MTRTWRLESLALLLVWALATALTALALRLPVARPRLPTARRVPFVPAAPHRRPPTARPPATPEAEPGAEPGAAPDEPAAVVADAPSVEAIDVTGESAEPTEFSFADEDDGPAYDANLEYYRWRYLSRRAPNAFSRSWRFRRGRILRPANAPFFSGGFGGDPCAVFPGACASPEAALGGSFDPPAPRTPAAPAPTSATLVRDGRRWVLANALLTAEIDVDRLCRVSVRRAAGGYGVAGFASAAQGSCEVREAAAPWVDRAGAAAELVWVSPVGSVRAVVALADDGASLEASVSCTDAAGDTWLANLGGEALTWTVAGAPVTLAPGGSVRVSAAAARRVASAPPPAAQSSSRS